MSSSLRHARPSGRQMVVPATEDDALKMIDAATERLVTAGWKPTEIGRRCRDSAAQIVAMNDPRLSLDLTEADH